MKFRLASSTLYHCVWLIDRYCSTEQVMRAQLQLVGVTALLIACKYEEIYPPEVNDCVYITDQAYTHREVLDMETKILEALSYKITVPNAHYFLVRRRAAENGGGGRGRRRGPRARAASRANRDRRHRRAAAAARPRARRCATCGSSRTSATCRATAPTILPSALCRSTTCSCTGHR